MPVSEALLVGRTVYTAPDSTVWQRFPRWFGPITCDDAGRRRVAGVWTGVESTTRDDALRAPYAVHLRVDDLPVYGDLARAELTVHVEAPGVSSLTQRDVTEVLQEGGRIEVQVHCAGGAFFADGVRALAP